MEAEKEKEKQQQQLRSRKTNSESVMNSSVPVSSTVDFSQVSQVIDVEGNRIEFSNLASTTTSAANKGVERTSLMCPCIKQGNHRGPPCLNPGCQLLISVSNSFHSIQREASKHAQGYDNGLGVLLPLQSNLSIFNCGGYNQLKVETDNSSPRKIYHRDENHEKDHTKLCLSAVERARQREIGKNPSLQQKLLKGDHIEAIKPGSKTTLDVALAFRSPHRQVPFDFLIQINEFRITPPWTFASDYNSSRSGSCAPSL